MYGMEEQRDYTEEAYNAHTIHTGDGEINYCNDTQCPYYVPKAKREKKLIKQDMEFFADC